MRLLTKLSLLLLAWLPATLAGCTVCESETGQQVRAGIFNDNFWSTLAAVASPFPVLLLTIAALHWRLPPPKSATEPANKKDEH